jgi:glycosyltransferase involved in cell wall biosynthesis
LFDFSFIIVKICFAEPCLAIHSLGYFNCLCSEAHLRTDLVASFLAAYSAASSKEVVESLKSSVFAPQTQQIKLPNLHLRGRFRNIAEAPYFWTNLRKFVDHSAPEKVVLLKIDSFLPWLAFRKASLFRNDPLTVEGIYFGGEQYRLQKNKSIAARLQRIFDRFVLEQSLQSSFLSRLFFLDHKLVSYLADKYPQHAHKLVPGADPWSTSEYLTASTARSHLGLPQQSTIALTLGAHSSRKGTIELLQALRDRDDPELILVIAGPLRSDVQQEIRRLVDLIGSNRVLLHDRLIRDDETWNYYFAADFVVCPYPNFYQSSNSMIRACAAGKPVIVSRGGVMEDAVHDFRCGISSETDPDSLRKSVNFMARMLRGNPSEFTEGCFKYAEQHSSKRFLEQFLQ